MRFLCLRCSSRRRQRRPRHAAGDGQRQQQETITARLQRQAVTAAEPQPSAATAVQPSAPCARLQGHCRRLAAAAQLDGGATLMLTPLFRHAHAMLSYWQTVSGAKDSCAASASCAAVQAEDLRPLADQRVPCLSVVGNVPAKSPQPTPGRW